MIKNIDLSIQIPGLSRTSTKIPGLSRPGIQIFKFSKFSRTCANPFKPTYFSLNIPKRKPRNTYSCPPVLV